MFIHKTTSLYLFQEHEEDEHIGEIYLKENKLSQTDFDGREISTLKEKVQLLSI